MSRACRANSSSRSASANSFRRSRLLDQSMAASPFHAAAQVPLVALGLSPCFDGGPIHRRQRPQQFHHPVRQQIVGVLHRLDFVQNLDKL